MLSRLGFGAFGVNLVQYEAPPNLEQCYVSLRIATQGLMGYVGSLGIAMQGLLDLECSLAPVDIWKEVIRYNCIIRRNVAFEVEL